MPLVIRSVEMFGLETAKEVLHEAQQFPQTEATVDWIINQFRRDYDWSDVRQENYCFVLAWVLGKTPPAIFTKRFHDIFTAPAIPEVLRNALSERLDTFTWDWDRAWSALVYWGMDNMRGATQFSMDWGHVVVEALARHPARARTVLSLLQGQYGDEDPCLMCWLRSSLLELAGAMRAMEAVPLLADLLSGRECCSAGMALKRIAAIYRPEKSGPKWSEN
jgi:hypothetical protein